MRRPILAVVLLVIFGLVPIGAWVAMAASLDPAGLGRSIGKAILVVLSPLALAGLLLILSAVMLNRTHNAGRIFATIGAAIIAVGIGLLAAMWLGRAARCVEGASYCTYLVAQGGAGLVYAIAHVALITLIWRARRGELSSP